MDKKDSRSPSILLVEDSPSDASIIRSLLVKEGFPNEQLVHAERLSEGMDHLAQETTDVVLLDLHLPDSQGIATFTELQRRWPDVPIVVLSGLDDEERAFHSVQRGAQDYLNKGELDGRLLLRSVHYAIQRKRSEVTLRDGREFAEGLIETAHALVLLMDVEGGILRFNSFAEHVSGFAAAEMIGTDWLATLVPKNHQAAMRELVRRAVDERETCVGTHPIAAKDGHLCEIRWAGKAIRDRQGQVLFVLFTGHDVSDLHEAQERAVQSERLAAIGQMIAGLAHESRNSLQRSQSCLDLLRMTVKDRPEAVNYIERIQDAQDHLRQLYDEVRGYASPLRLEIGEWKLDDILHETWDNLSAMRDSRDVRLECIASDLDLRCNLDRHRIEQVFRNILENAISVTEDPVEIRVQWSEVERSGASAIQTSILDNGPGFTAEQRRQIFNPFFTTKTHGTGLGMAISQRIIEAHGGKIELGEKPNPGAELVVTLPRIANASLR